ncbi:hypothetical protein CONCODRAFT_12577 [Conidiobolus coronatus NRRL 28638]|uniref:NADPH-dependent FMN reductase-like domain-containing protein n=1 Tax=Conidiobolus coronatus (strain ATCC 28846 / CBS 209.66 / NRRL 28638) TaxID=796925 RepID=A0A137NSL6_CONC2|nr:hypothetical protein CONCODRAFT_12577 [Conidiobolus coronatus NRRL 28638]|eukprot:KXN65757.1 hypothetical protein CONCODRAFT_12577 [Conidiobolus coronatus NRRL 28638]
MRLVAVEETPSLKFTVLLELISMPNEFESELDDDQTFQWSHAHLWVSPEQRGNITAVFKNQIDWIPLSLGSVRPTQGRTFAIAQVCGGTQRFNAMNFLTDRHSEREEIMSNGRLLSQAEKFQ